MKQYISFDVGIKNLSYCYFSYDEESKTMTIDDWNVVDLSRQQTVDVKDIESLTTSIVQCLNEITRERRIDIVIIENQPSISSLKSVQMAIFTFFVTLKCNGFGIKSINLYSATNKLKTMKVLSQEQQDTIAADTSQCKSAHQKRKKQAIAIANYLINDVNFADVNLRSRFENSKKRDDLADSFLQGYHYCAL